MKSARIGIVGSGGISKLHLTGMGRHPDEVTAVALVDPDEQARKARAAEFGIEATYATVEEMIAAGGLDAAIICTPTQIRSAVVTPLIDAGIPIFCEKPFSETYAEAAEMERLAREKKVPIAINQNFRRHFSFAQAKELLESGTLGKPLHLTQMVKGLRRDVGWRLSRDRYVMSIMSNHWFDGYRWILGEEPTSVYCCGVNSPATDGGKDTGISVVLRFPSGVVANLSESFSSYARSSCCSLDCEQGTLLMDYGKLQHHTSPSESTEILNPCDKADATYVILADLLSAARDGREPETSASDNLKTMQIMEAAYKSLETGQPVELKEMTL